MLIPIVKQTLMITAFVVVMMLIIEYINVLTRGNLNKPFRKSGWLQIISAAFLGIIPGCLGTYTAVSMYAHKIFSFPALVTTMIATSGDEAFFMFSTIPKTAIILNVAIFFIAIATGLILYLFIKNKTLMKLPENHLQFHHDIPECNCFDSKVIRSQLTNISFQRAVLMVVLIIFIFLLIIGEFGHRHDFSELLPHDNHTHEHEDNLSGKGEDNTFLLSHDNNTLEHKGDWNWIRTTFLIVSLVSLFIIATVNDHFIEEHLWNHIIKKHFIKIFLWTFGALIALHFINEYIDIGEWVKTNQYMLLVIAVLIGIIPQSGPHFIFVLLFLQGSIPFSILLANSIVQDGHGAIPLLAESRKSFISMKAINILIGLIIGFLGIFLGW